MSMNPKTLGEELVGAEIVAGKELVEATGSALETMEQGAAIWLQQWRWLFDDYGDFLRSGFERPGDPGGFLSLIESRSEHIASGVHQTSDLLQRECVPVSRIWDGFFSTVLRDWRSG